MADGLDALRCARCKSSLYFRDRDGFWTCGSCRATTRPSAQAVQRHAAAAARRLAADVEVVLREGVQLTLPGEDGGS